MRTALAHREAERRMLQQPAARGEILVVDDDPAIRDLLAMLFSRQGYEVVCYADGAGLLGDIRTRSPLCVILDVHIPGKSGLDILKELGSRKQRAPIFIVSGKADIPMAVEAIKNGAHDFMEKPFRGVDVVARVQEAIAAEFSHKDEGRAAPKSQFYFPGHQPLTGREQEVLSQLIAGATNKEAGRRLGISHRTIEIHRAHIMEKLGAKNATDLIRIVLSENHA
jgi:FixJ family two-component response regulator